MLANAWLTAAAIIVALGALPVLIGALLPRSHRAQQVAVIGQPRERVWALLTDYPAFPRWHPDIERIEAVGGDPHGGVWRVTYSSGLRSSLRVTASEVPERLVWEFDQDSHVFRGIWEITLTPQRDATRAAISQRIALPNVYTRPFALLAGRRATLKLLLGAAEQHMLRESSPA